MGLLSGSRWDGNKRGAARTVLKSGKHLACVNDVFWQILAKSD